MQLMHLYLMLDAFNPILAMAVLEAKDLPPFVMPRLKAVVVKKGRSASVTGKQKAANKRAREREEGQAAGPA